jgi:hypothetical protein
MHHAALLLHQQDVTLPNNEKTTPSKAIPHQFEIGVIAWVEKCDTIGEIVSNYHTINNNLPKNASVKF